MVDSVVGSPAKPRAIWQIVWVPATIVVVAVGFALLIWLGRTGFNTVVAETHEIVGRNLDSVVRISEIASRLQKISATLYSLMTIQAAGKEELDVVKELEAVSGEVARLRTDLTDYRDRFATPQQVPGINETLVTLENYEGAVKWVGSMLEIDFASAVSFLRPFNTLFDRASHRFDEITATAVTDARALASRAADSANGTVLSFIVITLGAALTISVGAWLAGRYQQKLRMTADILERLVEERTRELAQRSADLEVSLASLREAQTTLVMQEKMASLGGLVAGVAHEINTPIGVALTCVTMMANRTQKIQAAYDRGKLLKADFADFLETSAATTTLLQSNIERAANLVQTFKMVSADRTSEARRTFDLRDYLDGVLISLSPAYREIGHKVALDCPGGIFIDGYPGALAQVVTNLVMNSIIHGFGEGQAGHLAIAVSEPDAATVRIAYHDTGRGIAAEHRARIFDPFYTTRRGKGCTGLGLHIVYNLVRARLGGDIQLDDAPGGGARFIVSMPRIAPE
ncbi:MAG: HAMP domain-containing sensor histidine kinase [Rhodospirillaceae bacterium]